MKPAEPDFRSSAKIVANDPFHRPFRWLPTESKTCFDLNFKVINFVTFGSFESSSLHLYAIVNVLHFTLYLHVSFNYKHVCKILYEMFITLFWWCNIYNPSAKQLEDRNIIFSYNTHCVYLFFKIIVIRDKPFVTSYKPNDDNAIVIFIPLCVREYYDLSHSTYMYIQFWQWWFVALARKTQWTFINCPRLKNISNTSLRLSSAQLAFIWMKNSMATVCHKDEQCFSI